MLASPDNRANYLSFNFSNLRQLLKAVSIGGLDFQRTSHGTWQLDTEKDIPLRPPYELVLVGAGGQRLVKRLQSLRSQDLGVNFG